MTARGEQLVLDLPHRVALGRDDFFVTPSNAGAVAMVDMWPHWPVRNVALIGPAGSGKTHLVEVWRQRSGAGSVAAQDLMIQDAPQLLVSGALVIENAGAGTFDERALFHLINLAREQQAALLVTSREAPDQWQVQLADLRTRLSAFAVVGIGAPDDVLLRVVLVKLFADRQLAADEQVINYLVTRMPRSLDAARQLVAVIDRAALTQRAAVTRPFVARLLQEFSSNDLFASYE